MLGPALEADIRERLTRRDLAALAEVLADLESADIAELLEEFEGEEQAVLMGLLAAPRRTEVFSLLPTEQQEVLLPRLDEVSRAHILNEMPPDDRTELLEELAGPPAQELLASLRADERRIAQNLLRYPEDSVGRLMTPEYASLRPGWTVQRVLEHIRKVAPQKETVNDLYVVDDQGRLLDRIGLEEVVLAAPEKTVADLMDRLTEEPALRATDDEASAVEMFMKYDRHVLPVVDESGVMVGIVTSDDVLDLMEEEDTEDFQMLAGVAALEEPYFQTSYWRMMGKRLPWLTLLLAAELLTALAIVTFEKSIEATDILLMVLFLPLVNASAGNVGSQMAGLVIRGLAVQEMDVGDWCRIAWRELGMGITLGVSLAALGWLSATIFGRPIEVRLILAVSMLSALTIANLAGALIPLALKGLRLDPAVTSAPLIASVMDVLSAVIFFGSAVLIFRQWSPA